MKAERDWPLAVGRRLALNGAVQMTAAGVAQTLHVPCNYGGGHIYDVRIKAGMHPDFVVKHMLNAGWRIGGRNKLTCPDHVGHRKRKAEPMATKPLETKAGDMSLAAKRATRLVMQALEDYYDEENKRYRDGWNDARIASQTNASETHVKGVREEFFGPLGMPPELDGFRAELRALEAACAAVRKEQDGQIASAKARLARICTANGWPVE